jgi:hypothetical protein
VGEIDRMKEYILANLFMFAGVAFRAIRRAINVVYEALTRGLRGRVAVNSSPRGQFFSLFINSTSAVRGSFLGWGSLPFVWLGSTGVDAVVALGRAARAPVPARRLRPE